MKILVIHASAGAGHMKAAEAILNGLKKHTTHEAVLVDALDYSYPFFKKMYREGYFFLISKIPLAWAVFFGILDIPILQPLVRLGRRIYNFLNTQKLHKYLIKENFDCIISAHFMPNEVASALKQRGKITSKIITVVTDYDVHRIWLAKNIDQYCVASSWTKEKLIKMGIDASKVHFTGIPTDEKFSKEYDVAKLKKELGLKENMFTVLIATGSFGMGPIEEIIDTLEGFQVIAVCGHNKDLYERLVKKNLPNVKPCPLIKNMFELMAVSNAMITKPGGLSISEALVCSLPMIFFSAIPGQEANNIKVLSYSGVGISNCSLNEIVDRLREYKDDPKKYQDAVAKVKAMAQPKAVQNIIGLVK